MAEKERSPLTPISIREHLLHDCEAMLRYALDSGLAVPPRMVETISSQKSENTPDASSGWDIKPLTLIHQRLAQIVAPAKPRTIHLLETEGIGFWSFLGPVKLVRKLMIITFLCLAGFILLSLSSEVDGTGGDFMTNSGISLLINELFLISAAGLGASFAALYKANNYISIGTYDPKYESSYWVRFILGLIAGLILAELIDFNTGDAMTRPTLALLGGFSADAVHRILSRMVDTVESLVRGDTQDIIASREQAVRAGFEEQSTQDRLKMAAGLMRIRQQVDAGTSPVELSQKLECLLGEMMPMVDLGEIGEDG